MQQQRMHDLLGSLCLDPGKPPPTDLRSLFAASLPQQKELDAIHIEIGFGGGEHLLAAAARQNRTGFIGIEPFINGMAKILSRLDADPALARNIRLYDEDAALLLDWLPEASISGIDLFYPDPWPKKKHLKRRFVNQDNLDRMARVLKPGGQFRFASDIQSYVEWTVEHCRQHGTFTCQMTNMEAWRHPYPFWTSTRYETKALLEGRTPAYLTFLRL